MPPPLRWSTERCLAKDPRQRYVSTLDLARELEQVRSNLDGLEREWSGSHGSGASGERTPQRRVRRAVLSTLVPLGLLAAILTLPRSRELLTGLWAEPLPELKQIAVLPFDSDDGDPQVQALAEGLADTLTSQLTQLQQFHGALSVVPSSDVRQAAVTSAASARAMLGATLVVTGSLQRLGERVRLNGSLVDAQRVRQLRSFTLDEDADGLELQDSVVERVARMLEIELAPQARVWISQKKFRFPHSLVLVRMELLGSGVKCALDLLRACIPQEAEKRVGIGLPGHIIRAVAQEPR